MTLPKILLPLLLLVGALLSACNTIPSQPMAEEPQSQRAVSGDARNRAKIHTELGALYFQDSQLATALDELRIALAADSSYAPAHNVLGLVHMDLRENEAAEQSFRRALSIAPNDPEINNNYGWFLCQSGRSRESLAFFNSAVKNPLYPTPERAYLNAGRCAEKSGDMEGAEAYLQKAVRFSRNNAQAVVALAGLQYKRGNLDESYRLVRDLHRSSEPSAESLWLGLRLARKLGDRDQESNFHAQLRRRFPGSPEAQALTKGNFE